MSTKIERGRSAEVKGLLMDMLRTSNAVVARLAERLTPVLGLSLSELDLLAVLVDSPEGKVRLSDVSGQMLVSKTSVTRLVDGLERRGLVCRVSSTEDRRVIFASIADPGKELMQRAFPLGMAGLEDYLGRYLDTAEIKEMRASLRKVLDGISDEEVESQSERPNRSTTPGVTRLNG